MKAHNKKNKQEIDLKSPTSDENKRKSFLTFIDTTNFANVL